LAFIYFDLTVSYIFLLFTSFKSRFQMHARVFFTVQLNWYVICMKIFLFLYQFIYIFPPFTSKPFIFFIFVASTLFVSFFSFMVFFNNAFYQQISLFLPDFRFYLDIFQRVHHTLYFLPTFHSFSCQILHFYPVFVFFHLSKSNNSFGNIFTLIYFYPKQYF